MRASLGHELNAIHSEIFTILGFRLRKQCFGIYLCVLLAAVQFSDNCIRTYKHNGRQKTNQ